MGLIVYWIGRLRFSYKKATVMLCTGNLLVALYMLHATLSPLYLDQTLPTRLHVFAFLKGGMDPVVTHTKQELERIEISNQLRRNMLPAQLIERVKEIEAETDVEISRSRMSVEARHKVATDLAHQLHELMRKNSQSSKQGLEKWRKKKLQGAQRREGSV